MFYSILCVFFFFFKQTTAYYMRISDWSSDVCSSDLLGKLGEVRSSVDRPVIGRLVTAQRFGAAFENLFACENGKEVVHVDEIRLIFQRIGHIIRIGHEGGSVRFAVEPDFGDAFVAVLIGIEEI